LKIRALALALALATGLDSRFKDVDALMRLFVDGVWVRMIAC